MPERPPGGTAPSPRAGYPTALNHFDDIEKEIDMNRLLIPTLALAILFIGGCEKQNEPQSAVPPPASSSDTESTP